VWYHIIFTEAASCGKENDMPKWLILPVGCAFILASLELSVAASSQDELIKKIETLEQQLKELKEMQKSSAEKESHCMKVFGREKFCKCVAEGLPREVSFEQYVHTVITPKETLGYEGMTPDQKKGVDRTLATRDKCLEKEKGGFLW
jgi:hypothetical protein